MRVSIVELAVFAAACPAETAIYLLIFFAAAADSAGGYRRLMRKIDHFFCLSTCLVLLFAAVARKRTAFIP